MKSIDINAYNDTFISMKNYCKNYCKYPYLLVGQENNGCIKDTDMTLMNFNLSSIGSCTSIEKAELYLYPTFENCCCSDSLFNLQVYSLINCYDSCSVTWLSGLKLRKTSCGITIDNNHYDGYIRINITPIVNDWIRGVIPNYGIALLSADSKKVISFNSSRVDEGPLLRIQYCDCSYNVCSSNQCPRPCNPKYSCNQDCSSQCKPSFDTCQDTCITSKTLATEDICEKGFIGVMGVTGATEATGVTGATGIGSSINNIAQFGKSVDQIKLTNNILINFSDILIRGNTIIHPDNTPSIILTPNRTYFIAWNITMNPVSNDPRVGAVLLLNGSVIPSSLATATSPGPITELSASSSVIFQTKDEINILLMQYQGIPGVDDTIISIGVTVIDIT